MFAGTLEQRHHLQLPPQTMASMQQQQQQVGPQNHMKTNGRSWNS
jgi:hypothetical protein